MSSGVISDRFLSQPRERAAPARLTYSKISPLGSNSARANEVVRLRLPSMRHGAYLDAPQSFVSFKLKSSDATVSLPYPGVKAIFRNAVVRCAGQQLSNIDQFQLWKNIEARSTDPEVLGKDFKLMIHTNTNGVGEAFTAGEVKECAIPLYEFSSLFGNSTYIPLANNDPVELDLTVGDVTYGFSYADLATANAHGAKMDGIELSEITLHAAIVEIPQMIDKNVYNAHNGVWQYYLENVQYVPTTIQTGASNAVVQLPASMSSLSSVVIAMTSQTDASTLPLNVFAKNDLAKVELMLDGSPIQLPHGLEAGNTAIAAAYNRIARHGLAGDDYEVRNDSDSFIITLDCEALVGKGDALRSGVNCSASTLSLQLTFGTPLAAPVTVQCYLVHDALCPLDMSTSGTKTFELSI